MKINSAMLAMLLLTATVPSVAAASVTVTGQINLVEGSTAAAGGFPFMVTLINSPALCGNTNTSAYLLSSDANYRVNASLLLTAKTLGSTVTLTSVADANGACQIVSLTVQ
jgi:hypothetical protein